ncbi:hypothetical protein HMPREF0578_0056 [Mobiluncus mulieris 28-1]|nr:hypothetical protein HMPREF0578_0056 [Mobiluncus mulieris 28-1]
MDHGSPVVVPPVYTKAKYMLMDKRVQFSLKSPKLNRCQVSS